MKNFHMVWDLRWFYLLENCWLCAISCANIVLSAVGTLLLFRPIRSFSSSLLLYFLSFCHSWELCRLIWPFALRPLCLPIVLDCNEDMIKRSLAIFFLFRISQFKMVHLKGAEMIWLDIYSMELHSFQPTSLNPLILLQDIKCNQNRVRKSVNRNR